MKRFVGYNISTAPRWWNGRHEGLKILYRKVYEFESRLGD
jgi:predicted heme/steroid binding protein